MLLLITATGAVSGEGRESALRALYDAHDWSGLRRTLEEGEGPTLYQGAVAAAFDDARAEGLLRSAIESSPGSEEAYEAYEGLSHLYLREGRYHRLMEVMEKRWAAFPGRAAEADERTTMALFRGLPDQKGGGTGTATLRHDGSIFPARVDPRGIRRVLLRHRRLALLHERIRGEAARAQRPRGRGRDRDEHRHPGGTANCGPREVTVGGTRFEDVSFAVFPDDQEPWSIPAPRPAWNPGIPLLLGLRSLRWSHDGTVAVGPEPRPPGVGKANLFFDDDHLVATVVAPTQSRKPRRRGMPRIPRRRGQDRASSSWGKRRRTRLQTASPTVTSRATAVRSPHPGAVSRSRPLPRGR